MKINIRKCI